MQLRLCVLFAIMATGPLACLADEDHLDRVVVEKQLRSLAITARDAAKSRAYYKLMTALSKAVAILEGDFESNGSRITTIWRNFDEEDCPLTWRKAKKIYERLKKAGTRHGRIVDALEDIRDNICPLEDVDDEEGTTAWLTDAWKELSDLLTSSMFTYSDLKGWATGRTTWSDTISQNINAVSKASVKLGRRVGLMSEAGTMERLDDLLGGHSVLYVVLLVAIAVVVGRYNGPLATAFLGFANPLLGFLHVVSTTTTTIADTSDKTEKLAGLTAILAAVLYCLGIVEWQVLIAGLTLIGGVYLLKVMSGLTDYIRDNPYKGLLLLVAIAAFIWTVNAGIQGDLNISLKDVVPSSPIAKDSPATDILVAKSAGIWFLAMLFLSIMAIAAACVSGDYRRGLAEGALTGVKNAGVLTANKFVRYIGVEYLLMLKQPTMWLIPMIPVIGYFINAPLASIVYGSTGLVACFFGSMLYNTFLRETVRSEGTEAVLVIQAFLKDSPALSPTTNVKTNTMEKMHILLTIGFMLQTVFVAILVTGSPFWTLICSVIGGVCAYSMDMHQMLTAFCAVSTLGIATPLTFTTVCAGAAFAVITNLQKIARWTDRGVRDLQEQISSSTLNLGEGPS